MDGQVKKVGWECFGVVRGASPAEWFQRSSGPGVQVPGDPREVRISTGSREKRIKQQWNHRGMIGGMEST